MKYISIIAVIVTMCLLFAGCGKNGDTQNSNTPVQNDSSNGVVETEPQENIFRYNGAQMVLPADFSDYTLSPIASDYTFLYADAMKGIIGIEEKKEEIDPAVTSLESYAAYQAAKFGTEAVQTEGFWTLEYEDFTQNEPQMLVCVFYETEDSYWIVKSYCTSDMFETFETVMWNYVKSVTFE